MITLRSTKGSPLTATEMDDNWNSLQPRNTVGDDVGDADVTLEYGDDPIQLYSTTLTDNRTVTLSTTSFLEGDSFRIVRTGLGAYTLDVGGLKTIPSATAAFVDITFNGTAWILTGYGIF
jgi:hypothetical protein